MFKKKINVLVLGADGMLGYDVYNHLLFLSRSKFSNIGSVAKITLEDKIDLDNTNYLYQYFNTSIHFDYCINCVAYTDTAAAQTTNEGYALSYKLNALAVKNIAEICKLFKTKLIHISTDYVFSELSNNADAINGLFYIHSTVFPKNVYGMHKLLGEQFIKEVFANKEKQYTILRTSWLYGAHNNKSFIHKFINNLVKTIKDGKTEIEVTENEVSIPTSTVCVVDYIVNVMRYNMHGIKHAVPDNFAIDKISRYEFAKCIIHHFKSNNYIDISNISLKPVKRETYLPTNTEMIPSIYYKNDKKIHILNWDTYLYDFIYKHGNDILIWAMKNNNMEIPVIYDKK